MAGQAAPPDCRTRHRGPPPGFGAHRPVRPFRRRPGPGRLRRSGSRRWSGSLRRSGSLRARRLGRRLAPHPAAAADRGPRPARCQRRPRLPRRPRGLAEPVVRRRARPRPAAHRPDRPGARRHATRSPAADPYRPGAPAAASPAHAGTEQRGERHSPGRRIEPGERGRRYADADRPDPTDLAPDASGRGIGHRNRNGGYGLRPGACCGPSGRRQHGEGASSGRDAPRRPWHHVCGFLRHAPSTGPACPAGSGPGDRPGSDPHRHRHRPGGVRFPHPAGTTRVRGPGHSRRPGPARYRWTRLADAVRRVRAAPGARVPPDRRFRRPYVVRPGGPALHDRDAGAPARAGRRRVDGIPRPGGVPRPEGRGGRGVPRGSPRPRRRAGADRRPASGRTRAPASGPAPRHRSGSRRPGRPGRTRTRLRGARAGRGGDALGAAGTAIRRPRAARRTDE